MFVWYVHRAVCGGYKIKLASLRKKRKYTNILSDAHKHFFFGFVIHTLRAQQLRWLTQNPKMDIEE